MLYGVSIMLEPFLLLKSPDYRQQQLSLQRFQQHEQQQQHNHYHPVHTPESSLVSFSFWSRQVIPRIQPMVPFRHEKIYITLSFMLCVAVGVALLGLSSFHIYLVSTGQTTIEFHGNYALRRRYEQSQNGKTKKEKWKNPYSRGTILANWQQVYGISTLPILKWIGCGSINNSLINLLLCILIPNRQLPEYLPVPIPGQCTLRNVHKMKMMATNMKQNDVISLIGSDDGTGSRNSQLEDNVSIV
jgi:hypothetical protein